MGSRPKGRTAMEVGADGVALITIINPPVNSLSFDGIDPFKIAPVSSVPDLIQLILPEPIPAIAQILIFSS